MKYCIYSLAIILFCINHSIAQDVNFKNYTIEQGLSQNSVKCIFQDSRGYLWFGTEDGLNRYDGNTFKIFRPIVGDTTSLSDNLIVAINEDHSRNLWVDTYTGGLNKFDYKTETFTHYKHEEMTVRTPNAFIFEDQQHTLWICNQSVYQLNFRLNRLQKIKLHLNVYSETIHFFYQDKEHQFWIGTDNGLYLYNLKNGNSSCYKPLPEVKDSLSNSIIALTEDKDGVFWLGSHLGIYKFDKYLRKFTAHYSFMDKPVFRSVHVDIPSIILDGSKLWLTYQYWDNNTTGVAQFDKISKSFKLYQNISKNSDNVPVRMIEDKSGIMWFGTYMEGVFSFEKRRKFPVDMQGLIIGSFLEDRKGNLWVGTYGKGIFKKDLHDNRGVYSQFFSRNYESKDDNSITTLFEDHRGVKWAGTYYNGLFIMKEKGANSGSVSFKSVMPGIIKLIIEDFHHRLWIGQEDKLCMYNLDNKQIIKFVHDPENPNSISSNKTQVAVIDSITEDLWVATWNGLNRIVLPKNVPLTQKNVQFTNLKFNPFNDNSISDNKVISLCMAKNGVLWAGTSTGGINKIEFDRSVPASKAIYHIKRYTEKNGLPNNQIYGIVEDKYGDLWISTNNGLSKFNVTTESFSNYDSNDGLQGNEFYWRSYYRGASGKIYFGGINGYDGFYTDSISKNKYIPPVYITGFYIFNKLQVPGVKNSPLKVQVNDIKEITIDYSQTVISFDYVALNYNSPSRNNYAYKMEGFDKEWQMVGNQRRATYTNLDPGTYIFRVKASNNDNIWNNKGTSVILIIKPPFWKTLWFRMGGVLLLGLLVFGWYKQHLAQISKNNRLLKQKVEERTREIADKNETLLEYVKMVDNINALLNKRQQEIWDQSAELKAERDELSHANVTKDKLFSIIAHDLKSPFNSILGFSELLKRNIRVYSIEKIEKQVGYIHESAKFTFNLVENLLQWARSQQGTISFEPQIVLISEIVENELLVLRQQALRKSISIELIVEGEEYKVKADENQINIVVRNLISNAIKFSNKDSVIKVILLFEAPAFRFLVIDQGIGIPDDIKDKLFKISDQFFQKGTEGESGTGLGLLLCANFIHTHGGDIGVESELGKGSRFYFTIPVSPGVEP